LVAQSHTFKCYEKQFTLQNNIAQGHKDLIIHKQNIISANIYGLEIYNGVKWRRDRLSRDESELQYIYKLYKDKYDKDRIYLIGHKYIGEYKLNQQGGYVFKQLTKRLDTEQKLGYISLVHEYQEKVLFFGEKGVFLINRKTNNNSYIDLPKASGLFFFHLIDRNIILDNVGKNTYVFDINKNTWKPTRQYSFLQSQRVQYTTDINGKTKVLATTRGSIYFKHEGKTELIIEKELSKVLNGGYSIVIKPIKNQLYIKSHNCVLIYDMPSQTITYKKKFQVDVWGLAVTANENLWIATDGGGIFFIEKNSIIRSKKNQRRIYSLAKVKDEMIFLNKETQELHLINKKTEHTFNLGNIWKIKRHNDAFFICTSEGLYKKVYNHSSFEKLFDGGCYNVIFNKRKVLVLQQNQACLLDSNNKLLAKVQVEGELVNAKFHNNYLYISNTKNCFQIPLLDSSATFGNTKKLIFTKKDYGFFAFTLFDHKLLISNTYGIYQCNDKGEVENITWQIASLPRKENKKLGVAISHLEKINEDTLLVIPVLGGEHQGLNKPGLIIKDKINQYFWRNAPFQRLNKYEMDTYARTSTNIVYLITPTEIIEIDLSKKVNTDYAFKTYIRSAQVKVKQVDTVSRKEALRDSTLYYGNLASPSTITLPYPQNTLTFTYASDSWAAYERNLYSYQLTGLDEGWSDWSTEQKKEYTHLREGTYTFKVRCKNVYGTISSVDSYTFTILPPWHRTTWAYTLYVLAGLALLVGGSYGYSRYRSRQLYRRNQLLEQEVAERTEEILAQKEEITQQADMLKTSNDDLKKANEKLQQVNQIIKAESDKKVGIYAQEVTDAMIKLQQVREIFNSKGAETAKHMLNVELNTTGKLATIREKVSEAFPEFVVELDKALTSKQINKTIWQVAHCLKLGMKPKEIAEILPVQARSVSTFGSKLRKLGLL
jgi:hypothetical protein